MKGKKEPSQPVFWTEEREMSDQVLELRMSPLKWRENLPLSGQINMAFFKPMPSVADTQSVAIATFWRTVHHDGKISSAYLPSRASYCVRSS
jgi:hypothetical protein